MTGAEIGLFGDEDPATAAVADPGSGVREQPQLVFGSAEEFLFEQLLPVYVRDIDGRTATWCIEWFYHAEAVARIEALWRAWEHLRLDGATGASVWWRNHADHHMRALLDPQGPFYNCDLKTPREPPVIQPRHAPLGWFPDVRNQK